MSHGAQGFALLAHSLLETKDSPPAREPKPVLDSGFHAVDSGIQVLVRETRILDSKRLSGNTDSLSGIPDSTSIFLFLIPNSTDQNFLDSRIRMSLQKDCSPSASGSAAPSFLSLMFTQPKRGSFLLLQLFLKH